MIPHNGITSVDDDDDDDDFSTFFLVVPLAEIKGGEGIRILDIDSLLKEQQPLDETCFIAVFSIPIRTQGEEELQNFVKYVSMILLAEIVMFISNKIQRGKE